MQYYKWCAFHGRRLQLFRGWNMRNDFCVCVCIREHIQLDLYICAPMFVQAPKFGYFLATFALWNFTWAHSTQPIPPLPRYFFLLDINETILFVWNFVLKVIDESLNRCTISSVGLGRIAKKNCSRITFLRNGLDASWKWFVYLRHNMLCHHVINSTQRLL